MLSAVSNKEKPRSDSDNTTAAMSTQVFVLEEPQEDSQKTLEDMGRFHPWARPPQSTGERGLGRLHISGWFDLRRVIFPNALSLRDGTPWEAWGVGGRH